MNTSLYQCMKLNWLSGRYEWVTFEAVDEQEARARVTSSASISARRMTGNSDALR